MYDRDFFQKQISPLYCNVNKLIMTGYNIIVQLADRATCLALPSQCDI